MRRLFGIASMASRNFPIADGLFTSEAIFQIFRHITKNAVLNQLRPIGWRKLSDISVEVFFKTHRCEQTPSFVPKFHGIKGWCFQWSHTALALLLRICSHIERFNFVLFFTQSAIGDVEPRGYREKNTHADLQKKSDTEAI